MVVVVAVAVAGEQVKTSLTLWCQDMVDTTMSVDSYPESISDVARGEDGLSAPPSKAAQAVFASGS